MTSPRDRSGRFPRLPSEPPRNRAVTPTYQERADAADLARELATCDPLASSDDGDRRARQRAEDVLHAERRAELETLPGSVWGRSVDERLDALESRRRSRARRIVGIIATWATGGGVLAALGFAIRALIAHGDATAEARHLDETIRKLVEDVQRLKLQQAADDESHGRRQGP